MCGERKCWFIYSLIFPVVDPTPSNMGTSMSKSCPPLPSRCGGVSRLMVTPRVSGLERSQEKSLEPHFPEPVSSSSTSSASFPCLPSHSPVTASGSVTRPSPINGSSSHHNGSPPLSKPKPYHTLPGRSHSIYGVNNRSVYFKSFALSWGLLDWLLSMYSFLFGNGKHSRFTFING